MTLLCSDLISRTTVIEDPSLSARYPAAVPNRVTVTLTDGTVLVRELSHPPGHARNPLTDAQLAAKFHGLVDPVLGRERAVQIQTRISGSNLTASPHEVLKLFRR